jgi:hypothetical protein
MREFAIWDGASAFEATQTLVTDRSKRFRANRRGYTGLLCCCHIVWIENNSENGILLKSKKF